MEKTTKKPMAFSVSQEELFVILRYLHVSALMGLNPSVLEGLASEQIKVVMEVAERALIARSFLIPKSEKTFTLMSAVGGAVGACAKPQVSLIATINRPEQATESLFFHLVKDIVVSHTIPVSGIHQFVTLPGTADIVRILAAVLSKAPSTEVEAAPLLLPQAVISQSREAAASGMGEALAVLQQASAAPEEMLAQFASALAAMELSLTLVLATHQTEPHTADGFTLLQGRDTLWWLRPLEEDDSDESPLVEVKSITRAAAIRAVHALLHFEVSS